DGRELFGSRSLDGQEDCWRWKLTPATNTNSSPTATRLPLYKPQGFKSLNFNSNTVVMTGSKGSLVLTGDEIESGSANWAKTSGGMNGVSPDGKWLRMPSRDRASPY